MWITKAWPLDLSTAYNLADDFSERFVSASVTNRGNQNWCLEILSEEPLSLKELNLPVDVMHFSCDELPDVDWLKRCFENFHPIIVDKFYIYASHTTLDLEKTRHYICMQINAANAFGSGEHPTTQGCLKAISLYFDHKKHTTVLDLGCGSCILSMAIAKLGCNHVFAYDNDPDAVEVSRNNAEINHVSRAITVQRNKDVEFNVRKYDFIVSNILATPLVEMSGDLYGCLKKGGILAISGFTKDQIHVVEKYESLGMHEIKRINIDDWITSVLVK